MKAAVFSDIIYTLIHERGGENIEDLVQIEEHRYIAKEAVSLIGQIRETGTKFNLVTGSGERSYSLAKDKIPHDDAIIEQGGIIFRNGEMDIEWNRKIGQYILGIQRLTETLQRMGYAVEPRRTYLRLHRDGTDRRPSVRELEMLINGEKLESGDQLILPQGIKGILHNIDSTSSPPCADFMPAVSGKKNAVEYLLKKYGLGWQDSLCVGDDLNDIEMLENSGMAFVVGNSHLSVKMLARGKREKGYTSLYSGHDGTIDVLTKIFEYVRAAQ